VLVLGRAQDSAVGRDHLDRDEIVDAHAADPGQPAHAAAEREPSDAGVADHPGRYGETVLLRRRVQVGQQRAAADPGPPGLRIHRHLVEQAQVDHQSAVDHRGPRGVVGAAAHRDLEAGGDGVPECCLYVVDARAPHHDGRPPVDLGVPHPPRVVVALVTLSDHCPTDSRP
jgi:hypothetical protein